MRPVHCVGTIRFCVPNCPTSSVSGPSSFHFAFSFEPLSFTFLPAAIAPCVWPKPIVSLGYARFS